MLLAATGKICYIFGENTVRKSDGKEQIMLMSNFMGFFALVIYVGIFAGVIYLFYLLTKALKKYLNSKDAREEKREVRQTLGEALKAQRQRCQMTQEFVAESLGVSRQAVSKWENGSSDPSTSNLLALARLYGISAEELLRQVQTETE